MSRALNLVLAHYWYDKIASGEKLCEYREKKPYWDKRLTKEYDYVRFYRGYTSTTMTFCIQSIQVVNEKNDLCIDGEVWKISLGERC